MEHERRSDQGTLIKDFTTCVSHSFNERTNTLESIVYLKVPLKGGKTAFHKVERSAVCEVESGKHTEMNSAHIYLERQVKSIFLHLDAVSDPVVQYDDETGHHVEIGRNVKYIDKKKMFWPPVIKNDAKSGINYLDFCEE